MQRVLCTVQTIEYNASLLCKTEDDIQTKFNQLIDTVGSEAVEWKKGKLNEYQVSECWIMRHVLHQMGDLCLARHSVKLNE